jgi:GntR family transcriptional regulator, transcriptional repressor for pyruvate dehydrogenase complex
MPHAEGHILPRRIGADSSTTRDSTERHDEDRLLMNSAGHGEQVPDEPEPVTLVHALPRELTLAARVSAELESVIVANDIAAGQRLPSERELASQFGVSRTVIREAVRGLSAKGLVDVENGRGTVVRAVSGASAAASMHLLLRMQPGGIDMDKVIEVRRILENHISAIAAERRTEADLVDLDLAVAEAESQLGDPDTFVHADIAFHMALARATHNELFSVLLDSVARVMTEVRLLALRIPGTPERAVAHHRAVLAAVRAGDARVARAAMDAHMDEARETLRQAVESEAKGT